MQKLRERKYATDRRTQKCDLTNGLGKLRPLISVIGKENDLAYEKIEDLYLWPTKMCVAFENFDPPLASEDWVTKV